MKKQQFIHTHELLYHVAQSLQENTTFSQSHLDDYVQLNLPHNGLQRSKPEHKAAVQALSTAISEYCKHEMTDSKENTPPTPTQ